MNWSLQYRNSDYRRYVHDQFACSLTIEDDTEGSGVVWEATLQHGMELQKSQWAANESHALTAADAWARYERRPK